MEISTVHKLENSMILLLNFEGWDLEWSGKGNLPYDAIGKTPKGLPCVIEMKFRKKHYSTKMLEKAKYDSLMALDEDIIKLYLVNDSKGNFLYYLNKMKMPKLKELYCPNSTVWSKGKKNKEVYLLSEKSSIQTILNYPLDM